MSARRNNRKARQDARDAARHLDINPTFNPWSNAYDTVAIRLAKSARHHNDRPRGDARMVNLIAR